MTSTHTIGLTRLTAALCIAGLLTVAPAAAQQVPPMPPPVAVTLNAATTALLVMDVIPEICNERQPRCLTFLPNSPP